VYRFQVNFLSPEFSPIFVVSSLVWSSPQDHKLELILYFPQYMTWIGGTANTYMAEDDLQLDYMLQ